MEQTGISRRGSQGVRGWEKRSAAAGFVRSHHRSAACSGVPGDSTGDIARAVVLAKDLSSKTRDVSLLWSSDTAHTGDSVHHKTCPQGYCDKHVLDLY